jgi:hypothetical protein
MTDRELMQQALDALQEYVAVVVSVNDPNDWTPKVADAGEPARKAIEALRARLAQPEPTMEVTWIDNKQTGNFFNAAPPQREWQGLTDEERYLNDARTAEEIEYARAIEAKLKEKNT